MSTISEQSSPLFHLFLHMIIILIIISKDKSRINILTVKHVGI